jgi:hypothetical protein
MLRRGPGARHLVDVLARRGKRNTVTEGVWAILVVAPALNRAPGMGPPENARRE